MSIDYEKSFKKLVGQISKERDDAIGSLMKHELNHDHENLKKYDKGRVFAYQSIYELAKTLEEGTFFED